MFEHKLIHLLDLAHIDAPAQLGHPQTAQQRDYTTGALTGLAALGAGCGVPEV